MRILIDNALSHTPAGTDVVVAAGAAGRAGTSVRDRLRHRHQARRPCHGSSSPSTPPTTPRAPASASRSRTSSPSGWTGELRRRERARPDDVLAGAPGMRLRTLAAGSAAAALLAAGCGGKQETRTISAQTTTTRVEILKDAGDAQPGGASFDPSAIYQRESPGVVTIIEHRPRQPERQRAERGRRRLGVRDLRRRRDRHERARRDERRGRVDPQGAAGLRALHGRQPGLGRDRRASTRSPTSRC